MAVTAELEEPANTVKGTKLEILLPALLPLVGPGAITPTKNIPELVSSVDRILACISLELTKLDSKFMLVLLELFQVTVDPATNPEPLTCNRISGLPAVAPLGVMEVIEELTVGEAPRYGL